MLLMLQVEHKRTRNWLASLFQERVKVSPIGCSKGLGSSQKLRICQKGKHILNWAILMKAKIERHASSAQFFMHSPRSIFTTGGETGIFFPLHSAYACNVASPQLRRKPKKCLKTTSKGTLTMYEIVAFVPYCIKVEHVPQVCTLEFYIGHKATMICDVLNIKIIVSNKLSADCHTVITQQVLHLANKSFCLGKNKVHHLAR